MYRRPHIYTYVKILELDNCHRLVGLMVGCSICRLTHLVQSIGYLSGILSSWLLRPSSRCNCLDWRAAQLCDYSRRILTLGELGPAYLYICRLDSGLDSVKKTFPIQRSGRRLQQHTLECGRSNWCTKNSLFIHRIRIHLQLSWFSLAS